MIIPPPAAPIRVRAEWTVATLPPARAPLPVRSESDGPEGIRNGGNLVATIGPAGRLRLTNEPQGSPDRSQPTTYHTLRRTNADGSVQSVGVGRFELALDRVVGSEDGPLALLFSFIGVGVEALDWNLITTRFRLAPYTGDVYDVANEGFLVGKRFGESFSLIDPVTGVLRWTRRLEADPPHWQEGFPVASDRRGAIILDPRNGRTLLVAPYPELPMRHQRDSFFRGDSETGGEPRFHSLTVHRA